MMKKFIFGIALINSLNLQAATVTFEDGTQLEVPDSWAWSIKLQVKAPPKHCPPQHCPPVPPPVDCPTICDMDPYYRNCPLACDGLTPGDKCRRQREVFGE